MWRMGVPVATPIEVPDVCHAFLAFAPGLSSSDPALWRGMFDGAEATFVGSGRAALYTVLLAMKETSARDEVIIPAFVCPSVARAVVKAGLRVVLCDVDECGFGLRTASLERLLSERTLAVVFTHLYGYPCDLSAGIRLARAAGALVIEDAAQAFGGRFRGRPVGLAGDAAVFSFGMSKVLWGLGAGIVLTPGGRCAERVRRVAAGFPSVPFTRQLFDVLKFAGVSRLVQLHHLEPFAKIWASNMRGRGDADDFAAQKAHSAQLRVTNRLAHRLAAITAVRNRNAAILADGLKDLENIRLPHAVDGSEPVYLRLPLIIKDGALKTELVAALTAKGIHVSEMYDRTNFCLVREFVEREPECPVTDYLVDRMLNLPTHSYLTRDDLEAAVSVFRTLAKPRRTTAVPVTR